MLRAHGREWRIAPWFVFLEKGRGPADCESPSVARPYWIWFAYAAGVHQEAPPDRWHTEISDLGRGSDFIYGDRRAEALLLDNVYHTIQNADPDEQDVILLGDLNLPPSDSGMAEVVFFLDPVFAGDVQTTISDASLYDNFWWEPAYVTEWTGESGIDRFDEAVFANDDDAASLAVSDHRPIWVTFETHLPDDDGPTAPTIVAPKSWGETKLNR